MLKYVIFASIIGVLLFVIYLIIDYKIKNRKKFVYTYRTKKCLMTNTEFKYYTALKSILTGTNYQLLPQIALSAIIERKEPHKYQSELSRVADFVIFSPEFAPLLVIEINDQTHNVRSRRLRDEKVKFILKSANLPLLTIETSTRFDVLQIAKSMRAFGINVNIRSIYNGLL